MMFNIRKKHIFVMAILILLFLFSVIKVKAEENKVAVIYDTYNEFGSEENKLNSLIHMILSNSKGVDIISTSSYSGTLLDKYDLLVILYNNSSKLSKEFIQDLLKFNKKIMWIGKNFNEFQDISKNINYISKFSSADESYEVVKNSIYRLINGKEENQENVYLLIDQVYPFIDLNSFIEKIDFLYDQGIPFICSVMPVYENQDFDAMKRFCEVLRYAQSKGGKIILHSSVLFGEDIPGKDVKNKMDLAQQNYIKYGVYPLALDIPENFLYKEDYKDLIYSSNSIFIEKEKQIEVFNKEKYSITKFDRVIDKIDVNDDYEYKTPAIAHNIAFSFNTDLDLKNFKKEVNKIIDRRVLFNDPNYLQTIIKLGGIELSHNASDILIDNKPVNINEQDNNLKIQPKTKNKNENETIDIGTSNNRIIKITSIICVLFIIIVLVSIKIDRKKFFDHRG